MQKRLNVLFISSWYPCRNNPFNGNFVVRHATAVGRFADVYVVHLCSGQGLDRVETVITRNGNITEMRVYYPKIEEKIPVLSHILKLHKIKRLYLQAVNEIIEKYGKPDIIHANVIFPVGSIASYLKKKLKIPFVITEHWTGYMPENSGKLSKIVLRQSKIVANRASYVMPVSYDLKNAMENLSIKAGYRVIYNVVDTDLFTLKQGTNDTFRFLHVSTLNDDHKNVSGILEAVKKLSDKGIRFVMEIVGDGDIEPYLKYASRLGIPPGYLSFDGHQPIENIAGIMRRSDAFVLFSNYESFSCVISEALCTGIPVISSDVGAIRERLDESNGIIVKPRDVDALSEAMEFMINNIDNYDNLKIREEAVKKYNYDNVGRQIIDVYRMSLKNSGS